MGKSGTNPDLKENECPDGDSDRGIEAEHLFAKGTIGDRYGNELENNRSNLGGKRRENRAGDSAVTAVRHLATLVCRILTHITSAD